MENNLLVNGQTMDSSVQGMLATEQFLSDNYLFRRNVLNGKIEFTNNPHPLTDATGSRRYICLHIPQGQYINNVGDIDYEQLYAQVLHEVREEKAPYWFNNDEVARIQQLNIEFTEKKDIGEMVAACFRKPQKGEVVKPLNTQQMLQLMQSKYPSLKINHSAKVHLGQAMKELEYEHIDRCHVAYYRAVPLAA